MLSPAQFSEWAEFYALEPFGFEASDQRFGKLCSTILSASGHQAPPSNFMLRPPQEREPTHDEEVERLKKIFGGVEEEKPSPASTSGAKV